MTLTDRQRQTLLWAAVGVLFILALIVLGPVLTPFVAAAILAYALEPGVHWLTRHRMPRALAVLLVLLLTVVVVLAILLILAPIVQKEFVLIRTQLPGLVANISETVRPWLKSTLGIELRLDAASLKQWLSQHLAEGGEDMVAVLFAYAKTGGSAALQIVGLFFLVPVVLFYLLLDWNDLVARLRRLVPPRWTGQVNGLVAETDGLLGQYLRGQLLVMLALAVYYSLALLVAGFGLWLPIGVLTGLLIAIPYLGFALGLAFALIAGMLELGPLRGLVSVAVIYGVGQVVESLFLTPRLVGNRIGLHPVAVILALLAFGFLFGFVGVLLALPLAAVMAVGLRRLLGAWLASDFYQRG